jgi:bifunctional DNase/RNase
MHLVGVRVELPTNNPIVLLREAEGQHRVLPIFIGPVEATAIAFALQGVVTERPMTHDLMRDLLMELGVMVERVVITELRPSAGGGGGTFYAELQLRLDGAEHRVSSRPSDAIALAARLGTPLYADEAVLDEAAVAVSEDDEEEEEVDRFREFLEGVNPEDFAS